jgi:hypothetical protein
MESRWIEVGDGRGYLAVPESGSGPGLVIFAGANGARNLTALADLYAERASPRRGRYAEAAKALNTRRDRRPDRRHIFDRREARSRRPAAPWPAAIYYGEGIAPFLDKAGTRGWSCSTSPT